MLILKKALCMLSPVWQLCRYSSVVEHVIGNDGVVSPILTSGTSFLLSPYFKGFFYALFSAHFNMHVGVTRHSRRQTRQNNIAYLDKLISLLDNGSDLTDLANIQGKTAMDMIVERI